MHYSLNIKSTCSDDTITYPRPKDMVSNTTCVARIQIRLHSDVVLFVSGIKGKKNLRLTFFMKETNQFCSSYLFDPSPVYEFVIFLIGMKSQKVQQTVIFADFASV